MRSLSILSTLVAMLFVSGAAAQAPCRPTVCVSLPNPAQQIALVTYLVDRPADIPTDCEGLSGTRRIGCAVLKSLRADAERARIYAALSKTWSAASRAAFDRLLMAEDAFARAVGDDETDRSSGDGETDTLVAQQTEKAVFMMTLRSVLDHRARISFVTFEATESALAAAYEQAMAMRDTSEIGWGSVDKAGIQRSQRAWLAYREAFLAFVSIQAPEAVQPLESELTTRRTISLQAFLGD